MLPEMRLLRQDNLSGVVNQIIELISLPAECYVTQGPIKRRRLNNFIVLQLTYISLSNTKC